MAPVKIIEIRYIGSRLPSADCRQPNPENRPSLLLSAAMVSSMSSPYYLPHLSDRQSQFFVVDVSWGAFACSTSSKAEDGV
jgi:hypothetical protein